MPLDDLLTLSFQVGDALDPASRAMLASASQQLDIPPPRASLSAPEFARAEAARRATLAEALETTRGLVESSRFELQVLMVLLRLSIESEGLPGIRGALALIAKLLGESWSEVNAMRAALPQGEREKRDRRTASHFDAVFQQIYLWLARENDRAGATLAAELASDRQGWLDSMARVEMRLTASNLRASGWEPCKQALLGLLGAAPSAPGEESASEVPQRHGPSAATESEAPPRVPESTSPTAVLEVSPRFRELEQRLAAFRMLLESGQFEKANIVLQDLQQTLEGFDVAGHFPGLFAGFFELSARFAEPLSRRPASEPLRGGALAQLYRTDLKRFLELGVDGDGS